MHPALIHLEKTFNPSTLSQINDPFLDRHRIELWMKRDDLLHPVISGNKWRKLKYCLDQALSLESDTLISMGGVYSNHLHALAYVGRILGLKTVGLIRGERPEPLTPTLLDCQRWGMALRFVSRSDYRLLRQYREYDALPGTRPGEYWLPEGGAHALALAGIKEGIEEIELPYDVLCLPCGTGATLAGCVSAVVGRASVIGFASVKNAAYLTDEVETLLARSYTNWTVNHNYHFGGFARTTPELSQFISEFELKHKIELEPVYSGKMIYALYDLIAKNHFRPGQRVIALHTGGLQGNRGFDRSCRL